MLRCWNSGPWMYPRSSCSLRTTWTARTKRRAEVAFMGDQRGPASLADGLELHIQEIKELHVAANGRLARWSTSGVYPSIIKIR